MKLPDPIKELIENYCGINYEAIGGASLAFLVENRRIACELPSDDDYFKYLLINKIELDKFIEGLLVPETWFFRDTNPFVYLSDFSKTFEKNKTFLRILSIPCATGEETYSIAMTLVSEGWFPSSFSIYGVDLGKKFINIAQRGIYSRKSFYPQNSCEKSRYLDQVDNNFFSVKESIRRSVRFIHGNIIDPHLFYDEPAFDVIFARNILIYFSGEARKKALDNIDRLLVPNGRLFLGHADNISLLSDKFKPVGPPSAFVFEKVPPIEKAPKPTKSQGLQKKRTSSKLKIEPEPVLSRSELLEKAEEFANKGLFQEANTYTKKYIKTHGPSAKAYFLIGQIFAAQNNLDYAEDAFRKAIYLDSNHRDALFQLELLCLEKGDTEQAKILRDRLMRVNESK